MATINENFLLLSESYLFSTIAKKVEEFKQKYPERRIVRMGIGDVTIPLAKECIKALHEAADEMAAKESFKGYGPEQGYSFLREAIAKHDFQDRGINISPDEVFVSDGAKSDTANFTDLFGKGNVIAITDPVYPVYLDSNVIAGSRDFIRFLNCTEENNFIPEIPDYHFDIVYICSPNNPTGTVMSKDILSKWVDYAKKHNSIIMFDAAYEAFITEEGIPHSIYEIPGSEEVAVEFRSFSKTAGFTGLRCAYTVVPKALKGYTKDGQKVDLYKLWLRRQTTKFNGVPYVVQKAAAAVFTEEGSAQIKEAINYYLGNTKKIISCFSKLGCKTWGGVNSPYVWVKVPEGFDSWGYFDHLLNNYGIVCTPGAGFGKMGEGFVRFSGFGNREDLDYVEKLLNA